MVSDTIERSRTFRSIFTGDAIGRKGFRLSKANPSRQRIFLKSCDRAKGYSTFRMVRQHMKVPVIVQALLATPTLDQISLYLTLLARDNKLAPVIGRERRRRNLLKHWLKRGKNSVLLLGPSGFFDVTSGLNVRVSESRSWCRHWAPRSTSRLKATLAFPATITWMANRFPAVPVAAPRSRSYDRGQNNFFQYAVAALEGEPI